MIADQLGRSKNCIVTEFRRGGERDKYTAKKGQKYADDQQVIRKKKILEETKKREYVNPWQKKVENVEDRVSNLEMHLEILFDTIKSLKGFYG